MRSDELEEFFIETETHDHNQRNVFKEAIILNKEIKNQNVPKQYITYDAPLYFDINQVLQYVDNRNREKEENGIVTWIKDSTRRNLRDNGADLFEKIDEFQGKQGQSLNGKLINFLSRLQNKVKDERLQFLFKKECHEISLIDTMRQFTGYNKDDSKKKNLTIIDLSGIPFDVLSIVVSLINRLLFDFAYYYKKIKPEKKEVPFLVVLEEAHNYVPRSELSRFSSVKKSVDRLAKEGRKYGVSLMIVSQRPSEISETILSQCNNFVAMRLTNPTDQDYVKRLLPDSISAITETLPSLEQREALIIGDSVAMPTIIKVNELKDKPDSNDIDIYTEWKKSWIGIEFEKMIKAITKENDTKPQ